MVPCTDESRYAFPAQTDPERDVPSSLCSDRGAGMPCHTAEGTECIAAASPPEGETPPE